MKKIVFLFIFIASTLITLNAQIDIFRGIKSGMSENEYYFYCKQSPDFIVIKRGDIKKVITLIEDKEYILLSDIDSTDQLTAIGFMSLHGYNKTDFNSTFKENVSELYSFLYRKYGAPKYSIDLNKWIEEKDISKSGKIIFTFTKDNIYAVLSINKNKNKYYLILIIRDSKFLN